MHRGIFRGADGPQVKLGGLLGASHLSPGLECAFVAEIPARCASGPPFLSGFGALPGAAGAGSYNKALDITSCTIITGPAEQPVSQLHDRQPIMLDPDVYDAWLDPEKPAQDVKGLLAQRINSQCQFNRVGRDVNTAAINKQPNDKASMVEPINPL